MKAKNVIKGIANREEVAEITFIIDSEHSVMYSGKIGAFMDAYKKEDNMMHEQAEHLMNSEVIARDMIRDKLFIFV